MVEGRFLSNVFSNMNCSARLMVVGQNPGRDEVEKAEPFVGVSGGIWDHAASAAGMSRSDFYFSNVLRCYTPGNRKPFQEELDACRMFLDREIEILRPRLIVALGSHAFKALTGMSGIMKHVGETVFSPRYRTSVFPLLHPSPLNTNVPEKMAMFVAGLSRLKEAASRESPA
jgi:DNA polymerase